MLVSKEFTFESSHILPRHPGKCSRLHGHSFRLVVEVGGSVDKESQFVLDYAELSAMVQPIVDLFDHRHLNAFVRYPSSENICTWIASKLWPNLEGMYHAGRLGTLPTLVVRVSETQKTWAVWRSDDAHDHWRLGEGPEAEWRTPTFDPCDERAAREERVLVRDTESVFDTFTRCYTAIELRRNAELLRKIDGA